MAHLHALTVLLFFLIVVAASYSALTLARRIASAKGGSLFFDKNILERMAFIDALTGLPNRYNVATYFKDTYSIQSGGFLLYIDLDRFKTINDTLGHDAGDIFLREAAARFKQITKPIHTIFRLGGDEFLIASTTGGRVEAAQLSETLLLALRQPFLVMDSEICMTASIGISLAPEHGSDRTSLLKAADMAMYNAKAAGRNKFIFFDEQIDRKQIRRLVLERDLRKALANQELLVHYQPKWDVELSKLIGLEALLRWQHPKLGLISPSEFIPIAEESGIIVGITRWVLREVCMQNKTWLLEGTMQVCVSVNMSIRVFESGQLNDMVAAALKDSGMNHEQLELEITESIAMQDVDHMIRQLHTIRELGVRVSMDDFGTGYSSLGSLDEIPINALKIDQMFIRQSSVPSKQAIISTIITIARLLHLEVVAEGVETEEQIRFLQSRGCTVMQGYYYGKPMDAVTLQEWLKAS